MYQQPSLEPRQLNPINTKTRPEANALNAVDEGCKCLFNDKWNGESFLHSGNKGQIVPSLLDDWSEIFGTDVTTWIESKAVIDAYDYDNI